MHLKNVSIIKFQFKLSFYSTIFLTIVIISREKKPKSSKDKEASATTIKKSPSMGSISIKNLHGFKFDYNSTIEYP